MKAVMISIQPYWVFLIIAKAMGWEIEQHKEIEVRKTYPKADDWNKVVKIYCSKDKKSFDKIPEKYRPAMKKFLGKVIGEFVCDRIEEVHNFYLDPINYLEKGILDCFIEKSCLSYGEICDYRRNLPYYKPLYGWHISDLVIYDEPRELGEFFTPIGKRPSYMLTRPPQSWGYVEEEEISNESKTL
jgi:hypothetical protein